MDCVLTGHSTSSIVLLFSHLKDYFINKKNELFFFDQLIYGKEIVITLNGKKEGLELYYYGFGEKRYNLSWKNGKREGLEIGYYMSGKIEYQIKWKNGKREGLQIEYYPSGIKEYGINWKDDEIKDTFEASRKKKVQIEATMIHLNC